MHANRITQWKTPVARRRNRRVHVAGREDGARRPVRQRRRCKPSSGSSRWKWISGSRARSRRRCERKAMIVKAHLLPVKRQAELLEISRSNVYYLPAPASEKDLALMRSIDELHLEYPFLGARQLSKILAREGHPYAGRLHVGTLMAKMGIDGAVPQARIPASTHPGHQGLPVPAAPPRHRACRTMSGRWTSPTCRCSKGFIYLGRGTSTGRRGGCWRGGVSNTHDRPTSASKPSRRPLHRYGKPGDLQLCDSHRSFQLELADGSRNCPALALGSHAPRDG